MKIDNPPVSAFAVYKTQQKQNNYKAKDKIKFKSKSIKNGIQLVTKSKAKHDHKSPKAKISHNLPRHGNYEDDEEPPELVEITPEEQLMIRDQLKAQKKMLKLKKKAKLLEKKLKKKQSSEKKIVSTSDPRTESNEVPRRILESPITEGLQLLQWMIAPITTEKFFAQNWEKEPLYISRSSPKYYSHILNSKALDSMFRDNPLYYTRNVDVVTYENGTKQSFNQEGRAIPAVLWDYYNNGCSIRVLNPQTYNRKVHALISTLQEYFGSMVGANVYLTPPGSQGFAPHYDDIEAFVVQLEGKKYWKLYHPRGSAVLTRDSSPNLNRDDIGEPFMEIALEAGDILYFPRGVIHEGQTDSNNHSLHITISVYQHNSYVDLLEKALPQALKRAAENDIDFRKGLPLHFLQHSGIVNADKSSKVRNQMKKTLKALMSKLIDYVDVDHASDVLGRKLMHDSMPPVLSLSESGRSIKGDGDYLQDGKVFNRVEFGVDTMIRLVRYHAVRLVQEDGAAKLYYCTENANIYHGEEEQSLDLDPSLIDAVKALQISYPDYVQVEQLPIRDEGTKLQFVSDLWEHGLLVTSEPLKQFEFDEPETDTNEEESECK